MDSRFILEHDQNSSGIHRTTSRRWLLKLARLALIGTLFMLPTLAAAASNHIVIEVPFQFMVDNRPVPPGTYIVKQTYEDSNRMAIENESVKIHLVFLVNKEQAQAGQGASLIFDQYGDRYFLNGVRLNEGIIERLSESKSEAELRARNARAPEEKVPVAALK